MSLVELPDEIYLIISHYVPWELTALTKRLRNKVINFVLPYSSNNDTKTVKLLQKYPTLYDKFIRNYEVFLKYWTNHLCHDDNMVSEFLHHHDVFDDRVVLLIHNYIINHTKKRGYTSFNDIARWSLACDNDTRIVGWLHDGSFMQLQEEAYQHPCYFEIEWRPEYQYFINYTRKYRPQTLINYVINCNNNESIINESPSCLMRVIMFSEIRAAIDPLVVESVSKRAHKELITELNSDFHQTLKLEFKRPAVYSAIRPILGITAEKLKFNKVMTQLFFAMMNRPFGVKLIPALVIAWDVKNYPFTAAAQGLLGMEFYPDYFTN